MSVTCVSFVNRNYEKHPTANYGAAVTLAAPGMDVRSLLTGAPQNAPFMEQTIVLPPGSSLAAAHVRYEVQDIGFTALPNRETALYVYL